MDPREMLQALFRSAVAAADPYLATRASLDVRRMGTRPWVFAMGKGAVPMARGAVDELSANYRSACGGVVVSAGGDDDDHSLPLRMLTGNHPEPGDDSRRAADAIAEVVHLVQPGDDVIVLVSGGASSLVAAPVEGISTESLRALFAGLLRSGAPIGTMNAFRRRVLRWGGGRLAQALAGSRLTVRIASDVLGGDLAAIASGPCAPDPLRARDLIELAARQRLTSYLPQEVIDYLDATLGGARAETAKPSDPAFALVETRVILDNGIALDAIARAARELELDPVLVSPTPIEGMAHTMGEAVARAAIAAHTGRPSSGAGRGTLLVWGGETTVRIPAGSRGLGGRSQELALAAAEVLQLAGAAARGVTILAAGTDGRDGPTDAAGAVVDADTWRRIAEAGRDPRADLERHDSYRALDAAGALLRTGLTGTNVNDVVLALVRA